MNYVIQSWPYSSAACVSLWQQSSTTWRRLCTQNCSEIHTCIVICPATVACSRLPAWIAAFVPNIFYVTEKAWNFYPHTITGLSIGIVSWYVESKYFWHVPSTLHICGVYFKQLAIISVVLLLLLLLLLTYMSGPDIRALKSISLCLDCFFFTRLNTQATVSKMLLCWFISYHSASWSHCQQQSVVVEGNYRQMWWLDLTPHQQCGWRVSCETIASLWIWWCYV